ncbi:MAG: FAD-dependent oxidoreductase [Actinomycetota bacterium]|nr:FAD-dependent oxidoreductase [Actinomycetota bacterium]
MAGVVVVGASLGGLRAADALARSGYGGGITLVGDEPHPPYNRPPLSKEALVDEQEFEAIRLRSSSKGGAVNLVTGLHAVSADLSRGLVFFSNGSEMAFEGLVAATGLRPRALPIPKPGAGVLVLRTYADLLRLRGELAGVRDVAIIGAGFIGCALAASLTQLGYSVSVIAPEDVPMLRPLGEELGGALLRHHSAQGIKFGLSRLPVTIEGDARPERVVCNDGSSFDAQLVIEAVGSATNTEWLEGNGLELSDGILCDERLSFGGQGRFLAVGDVARFPNLAFDAVPRRVEHWGIAVDTGRYAGKALGRLLTSGEAEPAFKPMPAFWSDQFELRIQSFGMPGLVTDPAAIRVLEGDLDGEVVVGYYREDTLVGVVLVGFVQSHLKYRAAVAESLAAAGTSS